MLAVGSRKFKLLRGSDINRDGMYLELSEIGGRAGAAEVFHADEDRELVLNTFGNDVPVEAIEWIIAEAKTVLGA